MKIYIAGKITGEPLEACKQKFDVAEKLLQQTGANPVNPFKLGIPSHFTFEESKPHNFKALRHCQAIYMLPCWKNSPGAKEELNEAMRLKMNILFEEASDQFIVGNLISEQAQN